MGRLNYRSRIATFFEKLAHFLRFVRKIRVITAQTSESKKLRIGNGNFDMGWVGWWTQQITVRITGLLALKYFFDQRTIKEPSSETLLRLAELVLTLDCFSFAGNYYKQINGVAMGTKMGPSYANLFVRYVEHQFFNQYDGPKPDFYGRSLHWRLHRRNFIQQRGTQSFYYFSQFFSSSSKIYLGNFRNFSGFSRYQSLYQWQRFTY